MPDHPAMPPGARPIPGALLAVLGAVIAPGLAGAVEVVTPEVLASMPHDPAAFTQGLLLDGTDFLESTGLYGQSSLRRVDAASGVVLQQVDLPVSVFAEGLALAGETLIQLTYQENFAYRWDRETFSPQGTFAYAGEGWGLCHDGQRLVMSDGSGRLAFRDPATFDIIGGIDVTLDGAPVTRLNELECVGQLVYANQWLTNDIFRIDPSTGNVLTRIDAAGLLTPMEQAAANVLNGIAFDQATDHFFLTGKFWPRVFEVRFPFNPRRPDGCWPEDLPAVSGVRLSKAGGAGIAVEWDPVPGVTEYHVNSVGATSGLVAPGPHRPDLPGGVGEAQCDAPSTQAGCTDDDALTDGSPLTYYQVYAACGPGGAAEGP